MAKGQKTGGRPKGIPKKQTVREMCEKRLGKPVPEAMLALAERINSPGVWMDTFNSLMPYCYSKLVPKMVDDDGEETEALDQECLNILGRLLTKRGGVLPPTSN